MSYIAKPKITHPKMPRNKLGLTVRDYEGGMSTLCAGCGHDSISNAIIQACFELSVHPHRVAKISGIGCSSKTPAYFLGRSHGFNSVHGRMPSVATGANIANKDLLYIGVSGDGDTASIGMGQFVHVTRRNINMVYIVMNNGCYGLTKGQDSATADKGSASRKGRPNPFEAINLCEIALQLGAGFVARGFSGDKAHLVPFGEYVPLKKWLPFLGKLVEQVGDFSAGEKGANLQWGEHRIGMLICYELIFPYLAREATRNGADFLVNITNDAWYGRTSAPYQHFSMAVFRAVENRRALARAANTGISGFVDPTGKIIAASPIFEEAALTAKIPLMRVSSLYTRFGDWFSLICVVLLLVTIAHKVWLNRN